MNNRSKISAIAENIFNLMKFLLNLNRRKIEKAASY